MFLKLLSYSVVNYVRICYLFVNLLDVIALAMPSYFVRLD